MKKALVQLRSPEHTYKMEDFFLFFFLDSHFFMNMNVLSDICDVGQESLLYNPHFY